MRPRRLELHGFAAFREATEIDFGDTDLLAFVGPTGSGKSTIIDGIVFALYGSVVRYKSTKLVAPVISQLANEARVRLDFSVGEDDYTAVRVVRRTAKGATTKEARLERGDEVLAGSARELDEAVEQLLGLDFEQFTKTVVLPQGEFARFLTESAESRQALLRRLLGMELFRSMAIAARERAKTADTTRRVLDEQLAQAPRATDEAVREAADRLERLDVVMSELAQAGERRVELATAATEAERRHAELIETLGRLDEVAAPDGIGEHADRVEALTAARVEADQNVELARAALADAAEAAPARPSVTALERLVETHVHLAELQTTVVELESNQGELATELLAAERESAAADSALAAALEALESVRAHAGVAAFSHLLVASEPCPLCTQPVGEIPVHDFDDPLADATARYDEARSNAEACRERLRRVERTADRLAGQLATVAEQLAAAEKSVADQPGLDQSRADLDAARELNAALDEAKANAERSLEAVAELRQRQELLDGEANTFRRTLIETRDHLVGLEPPTPSDDSVARDWEQLLTWARDRSVELRSTCDQSAATLRDLQAAVAAHDDEIATLAAPFYNGEAPPDPVAWITEERGRSQAELASLESERARQAESRERVAELQQAAAVAGELGRLLSARGFEQWLMADVMRSLAARATDRLLEFSSGAYSLVTDGTDFSIRDHRNADEVRSARTLSGGETFLTSLALALALSESVAELAAEGAPRIESMFLDEGFGTLDSDTLDVAASAIEELGASGRLVGVVTHVRELADRIPVRVEVSRSPSGSRAVRTEH